MGMSMTCIEGAGAGADPVPPRRNERRRSSCVRRDPDDILRSLRAVKGELGRTLSLSGSTARRKYRHLYVAFFLLLLQVGRKMPRIVSVLQYLPYTVLQVHKFAGLPTKLLSLYRLVYNVQFISDTKVR